MNAKPEILDITMELRDEYTALVNRQLGETLQALLLKKLKDMSCSKSVLALDFTAVTSIHESFFDEFLVPVLRRLTKGHLGERYVIGFGIDQTKIALQPLNAFLVQTGQMFLIYNKSGVPCSLGAGTKEHETALGFVLNTKHETANQLAIQMQITKARADRLLVALARQ